MIHQLLLVWHNVLCVVIHQLTFLCAFSNSALLLFFVCYWCLFVDAHSVSVHCMLCDVVSSNQSGVLKHNTLTLGMLCQGGGHGRSSTLNFNLYNNTKLEPPAGRWLPLPPPPSANTVSIPQRKKWTPGNAVVTARLGKLKRAATEYILMMTEYVKSLDRYDTEKPYLFVETWNSCALWMSTTKFNSFSFVCCFFSHYI